jgi:hypothetical protein
VIRTLLAFDNAWTWGRPVADCPRVALSEALGLRFAAMTAAGCEVTALMAVAADVARAAPEGIAGMVRQADMTATTTAIRVRMNIPVSHEGEHQPTCPSVGQAACRAVCRELVDGRLVVNRLGDALSQHLRQHAANPVDWWPWCDEQAPVTRIASVPPRVAHRRSRRRVLCGFCPSAVHPSPRSRCSRSRTVWVRTA